MINMNTAVIIPYYVSGIRNKLNAFQQDYARLVFAKQNI